MNNIYYLTHGGPGSGRYPLGSGDRPYQKFEKGRKKTSGISGYISSKIMEKKIVSDKKRIQEQEKLIADKERVLRSGRATEVKRYKGQLSRQELQEVYGRLNLEQKIDEMSSTEILDNQKIINAVMNNIKKTTEWIAAGAVSYNTLASIYNSMVTDDTKKLPVLKIAKS